MSYQGSTQPSGGFNGNGSSKHSRSSVTYPDQSDKFEKFIFVTPSQSPEEAAAEVIEHLLKETSKTVTFASSAAHAWKVVPVAEYVKRRLANLHQNTEITHEMTEKVFDAVEEGCEVVKLVTPTPMLRITLSKTADCVDSAAPGYQLPLPVAEVVASGDSVPINMNPTTFAGKGYNVGRGGRGGRGGGRGGRGRGRGRGGRGGYNGRQGQQQGHSGMMQQGNGMVFGFPGQATAGYGSRAYAAPMQGGGAPMQGGAFSAGMMAGYGATMPNMYGMQGMQGVPNMQMAAAEQQRQMMWAMHRQAQASAYMQAQAATGGAGMQQYTPAAPTGQQEGAGPQAQQQGGGAQSSN